MGWNKSRSFGIEPLAAIVHVCDQQFLHGGCWWRHGAVRWRESLSRRNKSLCYLWEWTTHLLGQHLLWRVRCRGDCLLLGSLAHRPFLCLSVWHLSVGLHYSHVSLILLLCLLELPKLLKLLKHPPPKSQRNGLQLSLNVMGDRIRWTSRYSTKPLLCSYAPLFPLWRFSRPPASLLFSPPTPSPHSSPTTATDPSRFSKIRPVVFPIYFSILIYSILYCLHFVVLPFIYLPFF